MKPQLLFMQLFCLYLEIMFSLRGDAFQGPSIACMFISQIFGILLILTVINEKKKTSHR